MHKEAVERLKQAINLKVDLPLDLLSWAEKYFYLPPTSPVPGKWRRDIVPYQAGAMQLISSPTYSHVFLVWGAQTGKSTVAIATVLYHIHYDPATILFVLPTQDTAREFSRLRLESSLRASKELKDIFNWTYNNPENTTFWKTFPGGWVSFAWSGSLAQLASKPVRIVIMDEIDRFEITGEGDAFSLAEKRTQAFWNRKLLISSTPTVEGTSRIWYFWNISNQYKFFIPCPKCKKYFVIEWKHIKWENEDPETAYVECPNCGYKINEKRRRKALLRGKWQQVQTGKKGYVALHLPAFYSPFLNLSDIVREFLEVRKYPERLRVFVNTVLAEPWRDEYEEEEIEWIFGLQKESLPEVDKIYVGVDVQVDRIEASLVGFTADDEIVVLDHKQFFGDIMEDEVWIQLWQNVLWGIYPKVIFVDSSAYTDIVYKRVAEVRRMGARQVFAIKGIGGQGIKIIHNVKYIDNPRIPLVTIGVDNIKELIYARIQNRKGIYFKAGLPEEYFLQIVSEKPVIRYHKGVPVREWKRTRKRNEALDCLVYAIAAKFLVANQQTKVQQIKKSKWLDI